MQIHSLPLGAAFGAVKIVVFPVTLYTKQYCAHKHCFIRHYRCDDMKMRPIDQSPQINVTQRRGLEKWIVWSGWASKVKINAFYKTMKVFFDLACMSFSSLFTHLIGHQKYFFIFYIFTYLVFCLPFFLILPILLSKQTYFSPVFFLIFTQLISHQM